MTDITRESTFQNDIIKEMVANGWVQGTNSNYQRETVLYECDALDYVQRTQSDEWEKFCRLFPQDPEVQFIKQLVKQLGKASEQATDRASRTYGNLCVLRHGLKIRKTRFSLCQFNPEHSLNPDVLARYEGNICRVVPEVVYGTHSTAAEDALFDAEASFRGMTNHLLSNPDKFNSFLRLMLSTNLRS